MTTTNPSVNPTEISQFLSSLYGLEITATEADNLTCDKFGALATYVNEQGEVKGKLLCDLAGAAKLGAALTQIPLGGVEDAVESGALTDNLKENVGEVFNIAVNLLPNHESERLVLKDVVLDSDEIPATDDAVGLKVSIQRYGDGNLFVF